MTRDSNRSRYSRTCGASRTDRGRVVDCQQNDDLKSDVTRWDRRVETVTVELLP